jgi:DNA-binding NarL/FixJ family response regulator
MGGDTISDRGRSPLPILGAGCLRSYYAAGIVSLASKRKIMEEINHYVSRGAENARSRTLTEKIAVYILDDHPLLVRALGSLIKEEKDMKLAGSGADWRTAMEEFKKSEPDVVILDITLGTGNGIEVLKNLRVHFPDVKVLMLSMHDETLYAMRALKAGASGYIMKEVATERLVQAVRAVAAGEIYLSEKMGKRTMFGLVGRGNREQSGSPITDLSDRELEVFGMIGDGVTTRGIAEKLSLSVKTVETHRAHIKEKMHLNNSTELVQHAIHWRSF